MKMILPVLILISSLYGCKKGKDTDGDNGPAPTLNVEPLALSEGNTGTTAFNVSLKLSAATSKTVTVKFSTAPGSAKAVEDYTGITNQTITFQPGETSKIVPVTIIADDIREGDDDFGVLITDPVNASIAISQATISILNDDLRIPLTNTGYDAPTSYPGYTLAWSDEFNSTALDPASWTVEGGNGCPAVCGWGNNELEYYTGRPENLFFQDGNMVIEARKEAYNGFNYTSSKLITRDKKSFKFGRMDIRAKLPIGQGIWPAIWMLPQDNVYGGWPKSGEIDIMEMVGHEPNRTHGTLHFGPGPGSTVINRSTALSSGTLHDEFHVYSLEWKEDQLKWYLDGNLFSTINRADVTGGNYPFNESFFFIINLAVGGNWPGSPNASTVFPQWLVVDYVRVYQ